MSQRCGDLLPRVWVFCDSIKEQDLSHVGWLSGMRLVIPSKFLGGSRSIKLTATLICQQTCCPLSENLLAPIRPILTPIPSSCFCHHSIFMTSEVNILSPVTSRDVNPRPLSDIRLNMIYNENIF